MHSEGIELEREREKNNKRQNVNASAKIIISTKSPESWEKKPSAETLEWLHFLAIYPFIFTVAIKESFKNPEIPRIKQEDLGLCLKYSLDFLRRVK